METTHRSFRRRQLLQLYALFVELVCQELGEGLGGVTSFVVMDIVYAMVRLLSRESGGGGGGGGGGVMVQDDKRRERDLLMSLALHILSVLCTEAFKHCPEVIHVYIHVRTVRTYIHVYMYVCMCMYV